MHKVLRNALWLMVVVTAATVVNAVVPAFDRSASAVPSSNTAASDQPKTHIVIIYVGTDTVNRKIYAWIKNVGAAEIRAIDSSDLSYKTSTTFNRLPYNTSQCTDCWSYSNEGDTVWRPRATIKVTVHMTTFPSGHHVLRFVTSNGVGAEKEFIL